MCSGRIEPVASPIQDSDHRLSANSIVTSEQLSYWKANLAGIPSLMDLPTDRSRPAVRTLSTATRSTIIESPLFEALYRFSVRESTSLYVPLLGALHVLLGRYSGQDDIVIGCPIANGRHANVLLLRTDVSGEISFSDLLERVRRTCEAAEAHKDVPFKKVAEAIESHNRSSGELFVQVMFTLQNGAAAIADWRGRYAEIVPAREQDVRFELALTATEMASGLILDVEYSTDVFDAATIDRMLGHLKVLLAAVVTDQ